MMDDGLSQAMIVETQQTGEVTMTKTGSKTDYRNRLLSLLIAADEQENDTRMNVDSSRRMDYDDYDDDDDEDEDEDCFRIKEEDQNIMRSNFNMGSCFAGSGGHTRRHDGGGGSRTACRNDSGSDDENGCCGAKRKRIEVKKTHHRANKVNSSYVGSGCLNDSNKNTEAFNLLRNELLFSNVVNKCERKSRDKECPSNDYCNYNNSILSSSSSTSTTVSSSSSTPTISSTSSSSASSRPSSPRGQQQANGACGSSDFLTIRFDINLNSSSSGRNSLNTSHPSSNSNPAPGEELEFELEKNLILKPINNLLKYNLNYLHIMRKDTLTFLIELNLKNNIQCPFDLLSYERLKKINRFNLDAYLSEPSTSKYNYNYSNIKRLTKIIKMTEINENPLDRRYLKQNNLLPSCVSTFLMPFYFDIFKVTELSQFSQEQIQMMLCLKRSYKAQIYLNYESLISYFRENIVWNSFVLFKYKFFSDNARLRMGLFNFYLSFVHILTHLELVIAHEQKNDGSNQHQLVKDHIKKAIELSNCLPYLLETLIVTGLFKQADLVKFRKFYTSKYLLLNKTTSNPQQATNLDVVFYEQAHRAVEVKTCAGQCFPLKLKNLCRIKIKDSMSNYNASNVDKLNIPKSVKSFLMYDNEINDFFLKHQFS